jgi:hypothetical protein
MMPARKTPLRTHTPLRPGAPLPRVAGQPKPRKPLRQHRVRHVASDTRAVREDLTKDQRDLLHARYGGRCESQLSPRCPIRLPEKGWHAGHRTNRGRGGNNTDLWGRTANCAWCNWYQEDHTGEAEARGLYLRTGLDPRTEPLVLPDGREMFLLGNGRYWDPATGEVA